jgi:hypothetical protein
MVSGKCRCQPGLEMRVKMMRAGQKNNMHEVLRA